MATTPDNASYSAKDITVLEALEPVRLRPGMYIGSAGLPGPPHPSPQGSDNRAHRGLARPPLVVEGVDKAVEEAMAGHNGLIGAPIHPDNSVPVRDRGRGIPTD